MHGTEDLLKGDLKKIYIKYLIPSIMASIAISMYVFVDTMFIGLGVGSEGLAALNIALPTFTLFSALFLIIGMGGATTLSIAIGEGRGEDKTKIFSTAVFIAAVIGGIIALFGFLFTEKISILLGATEEILPLVTTYFSILVSFAWAFILAGVLGAFIRNDHNPKLVMRGTIIANITNIILDYIFIFIFHWGMRGAILATVMSPLINLLILSIHFRSGKNTLHFSFSEIDLSLIKRIIPNGFGSFVLEISRGIVIFIFNMVLLALGGEIYVASYGVIINIAFIGTSIFTGVAHSAQPIISVNFGAGEMERVKRILKYACVTASAIGALLYLVLYNYPEYVVSLFTTGDEQLITIASHGIQVFFFSLLFVPLNVIFMYYFQSIERARLATIQAILSGFLFVLLGLVLLVPMFGVDGVWMTVPFAEMLTLLVALVFLKRSKKKVVTSR